MKFTAFFVSIIWLFVCNISAQESNFDTYKTTNGELKIQPILHGSLILTHHNKTIYIDPYGSGKLYANQQAPDIILITDIHGDHLNHVTLDSINISKAIFIAPQAVANKLPYNFNYKVEVLSNGQGIHRLGFFIKAVPMYNLPDDETSRHPKGRGNGYLITVDDKTIYVSGDTEDISEMRTLQNIDIAFICMNLPYTMDIHQAASAVLEFQPKIVYPYHYRGLGGFSDVNQFKNLINTKNKNIEVRLKKWYPTN